MKLFLTSQANQALSRIVPMLPKKPEELIVMFIPTAEDPYGSNQPWTEADRNKLKELKFKIAEFDLKNKSENEVREQLSAADIIFVGGGNTFYLLEKSIVCGLNKLIKELVNSDKIYIGSSAGSCIAGPDLEPVAPIDEPEKAKLDSTKAFDLVDFVVLPHHGREKYDEVHEKVMKDFSDKYKLIPLTDEQFIVSDGKSFKIF